MKITSGWFPWQMLGLALVMLSARAADLVPERWRPEFHFTPLVNWMNDPNGMVYFQGEYHLFYQYNPYGDKWGHMSWGHAISRDLVHWEHLPVGLYEENAVMIFSGSAVVDWKNTSGFSTNGEPPLVAIYTGRYTNQPLQNQHIAYSIDRGRTWTKYSGNPVIDIGARDFRDPKVIWHEGTKRWVMTVAMPTERKVRFYGSPNLKEWTLLSDFGPAGSTNGIWECPDLFPVKVEGRRDSTWVLIVNVGSGAPAGGSGCQYFVGHFDGARFTASTAASPGSGHVSQASNPSGDQVLWADFGPDFYAAVTWSDIPKRDGRRLWIGWMSNWQYAGDVPTTPWRNAMTLPRELAVRMTSEGPRLVQTPVRELHALRQRRYTLRNATAGEANDWLERRGIAGSGWELEVEFDISAPAAHFEFGILRSATEATTMRFERAGGVLSLDRTRSGRVDFNPRFTGAYRAPIRVSSETLRLRLYVDTSSVEVFANDGETVLTSLVFPDAAGDPFQFGNSTGLTIRKLTAWRLSTARR